MKFHTKPRAKPGPKPGSTQAKAHIHAALRGFDALPDSANVRRPVVAALNGIAEITTRRWEVTGALPRHFVVGNVALFNVGAVRQSMRAAQMGGAK